MSMDLMWILYQSAIQLYSRLHHAKRGIRCEARRESQVELQDGPGCSCLGVDFIEREVECGCSDICSVWEFSSRDPQDGFKEQTGNDHKVIEEIVNLRQVQKTMVIVPFVKRRGPK